MISAVRKREDPFPSRTVFLLLEKWLPEQQPFYGLIFVPPKELSFVSRLRSLNRADTRTGTAVNAGISVDNVLAVSLGNCADRTFTFTGTASDAVIGNYICHFVSPPQ